MPPYDPYKHYDQFRIHHLMTRQEALIWNDYLLPEEKVDAHIEIALLRAKQQLSGHPDMPEDEEVGIRFPGLDPVGKYSLIDMKFAQREAVLRNTLQTRPPEVQGTVLYLLNRCTTYTAPSLEKYYTVFSEMKSVASAYRNHTRAAKVCVNEEARRRLYQEAKQMETSPEVVACDKMFQGFEYMAGVRSGPIPEELKTFYRETLDRDLESIVRSMGSKVREVNQEVEKLTVKFEDLDHKLLQRAFANPHNWGRSQEELERIAGQNLDLMDAALPPYAAATAGQVLNPAFDGTERDSNGLISRGDMIIIDGKTVREAMQQQFADSGLGGSFEDFYRQNVRRMTNELVAAGLMAGKRVEAFLPDARGRIPKEPAQIVKEGYAPSPLQPEKFSRWERFFAKRGFYQEKVARQAEYEKAMAARERVRTNHRTALLKELPAKAKQYNAVEQKELFFAPIMDELDFKQLKLDEDKGVLTERYDWDRLASHLRDHGGDGAFVSTTRSEAVSTCVCYLALQGHKFQDIMDPNKLQAERLEAARMFMAKGEANDQEWLGQVFYHGHKALIEQASELVQDLDLRDEAQLLPILPELEGMTGACFSVSQMLAPPRCRAAYLKEGVAEAKGDVELGCQKACALDNLTNDLAGFSIGMLEGMMVQSKLAASAEAPGAELLSLEDMKALAQQSVLASQLQEGRSLLECVPKYTQSLYMKMGIQNAVGDIHAQLDRPENRNLTKQLAASGELTKALSYAHQSIPAKKPNGDALMAADTTYTLKPDQDGALRSEMVRAPHPVIDHVFQFRLEPPAPVAERQAPQRQEPQRQAPQRGGLGL